jgi:hypothetical protein
MRVLLRRKLAECIDGVDLIGRKVGDVFDLPASEARLLFAEEWAIPERRTLNQRDRRREFMSLSSDRDNHPAVSPTRLPLPHAADRPRRRK